MRAFLETFIEFWFGSLSALAVTATVAVIWVCGLRTGRTGQGIVGSELWGRDGDCEAVQWLHQQ